MGMNQRLAIEIVAVCRRRTMRRGDTEGIAFAKLQIAEFGLADARGAFEYRMKDGLKLAR